MFDNNKAVEKVILVSVCLGRMDETDELLDELEELAETAGAQTVGRIVQIRDSISPATYVGSGKIDEIREMVECTGASAIICDDELSPVQYKNLENSLDIKVMDRTLVILDIFAKRANTSEGKLQVELAQLKYRSARLIGMKNLSRQGGGIGTRGPGEKKLESDRRAIRDRISRLKGEIRNLESHRSVTRSKRENNHIPVAAIAGYTNAGKSTLLNTLTHAGILEEDKLFATLDPTTRKYRLPSGNEILLTDTVGFIRKLPHHLIDAFRSTLEEAKYADIIIHVVDCSAPAMDRHMETVYATLNNLGISGKCIITVFNKTDRIDGTPIVSDAKSDYAVLASFKTGYGVELLDDVIEKALQDMRVFVKRTFSYNDAGLVAAIRKHGQIVTEQYNEDGIYIEAYVPTQYIKQ